MWNFETRIDIGPLNIQRQTMHYNKKIFMLHAEEYKIVSHRSNKEVETLCSRSLRMDTLGMQSIPTWRWREKRELENIKLIACHIMQFHDTTQFIYRVS